MSKARDQGVFVALIFLIFLSGKLYLYHFSDFTITDMQGTEQPVSLPYTKPTSKNDHVFIVSGTLTLGVFSPRIFNIITDDETYDLVVNNRKVDLGDIPKDKLSDWRYGFIVDLSDYLNVGDNRISLTYTNYAGPHGVKISGYMSELRLLPFRVLWGLCVISLLVLLLRKLGFDYYFVGLLVAGILLRMVYLWFTGYEDRGHDTGEHIDYVLYFSKYWNLPELHAATDGAYFHPPLYYFLMGKLYALSDIFFPGQEKFHYNLLMYYSSLCSVGFLIVAAKTSILFFSNLEGNLKDSTIQLNVRRPLLELRLSKMAAFFSTALVAFWPSIIIHSSRIGNDPMLYFLFALAMYFSYLFYLSPTIKHFLLAVMASGLAIMTKANGVILGCIGFLILVFHYFRYRPVIRWKFLTCGVAAAIILGGATAVTFYPGIKLKMSGDRTNLYIDNITNVSSALRTNNRAENYLWLDVKTFVTKPYTSPWDDDLGRQYFANYLLKTSLVGEWKYSGVLAHNSAVVISWSLLLMLAIVVVGAYRASIADIRVMGSLLWTTFFLFAAIYYMKMTFPVNIDFRYVLPALIPCTIFYNYSVFRLATIGSMRLAFLGLIVQSIFIVGSVLFVLHFFLKH